MKLVQGALLVLGLTTSLAPAGATSVRPAQVSVAAASQTLAPLSTSEVVERPCTGC